eukprot:scaffold3420_cov115-Isochrysis_galbana.AAC.5
MCRRVSSCARCSCRPVGRPVLVPSLLLIHAYTTRALAYAQARTDTLHAPHPVKHMRVSPCAVYSRTVKTEDLKTDTSQAHKQNTGGGGGHPCG